MVCGDHFGLIVDRAPGLLEGGNSSRGGGGLVGLVDDAIVRGEREKAVAFLSLEASHGMVSAQDGKLVISPFIISKSVRRFVLCVVAMAMQQRSYTNQTLCCKRMESSVRPWFDCFFASMARRRFAAVQTHRLKRFSWFYVSTLGRISCWPHNLRRIASTLSHQPLLPL